MSRVRVRAHVFAVAVAGIAIFSVMDAVMKDLSLAIGTYSALFWRSLAGVVFTTALFVLRRGAWPSRASWRIHVVRGAVSTAMALAFFWGLARVPMAEAVALTFVAPLLALYLAAVLLGEHVSRRTIGASCVAALGVLVVVAGRRGDAIGSDAGLGTVAILASAVCYAFNIALMRRQAQVAGPIEVAFAQSLVVAVLLTLGAPFAAHGPGATHATTLIFAAALATASLMLLAWAYARAEASYLAPSEYTAFVWASLLGFVVFDERLAATTVAGAALIVAGCVVAARQTPTALESPELS